MTERLLHLPHVCPTEPPWCRSAPIVLGAAGSQDPTDYVSSRDLMREPGGLGAHSTLRQTGAGSLDIQLLRGYDPFGRVHILGAGADAATDETSLDAVRDVE